VANNLITSGLIGQYQFDEASGTTLFDHSGSGYNCIVVGGAWNTVGLSLNGTASQYVSCPGVNQSSVQTIMVFADAWTNGVLANVTGNAGYQPLAGDSDSSFAVYNGYGGSQTAEGSQVIVQGHSYSTVDQTYDETWGPSLVTLVMGNAAADTVYIGGSPVAAYETKNGSGSFNITKTGTLRFGASGSVYLNGTLYYALLYNRALSATEVKQNYLYLSNLLANRGVVFNPINPSTNNQLLFVGDSRTVGYAPATQYPAQLSLNDAFIVRNLGVSGGTATGFTAEVPALCGLYAPNAFRNVVILWGIINGPSNATSALAATRATAKGLKMCGFTVYVGTEISGTGFDAEKNTYNSLLDAGWESFADGVVDFHSNPNLGADGAYASSTYFYDQLKHPSTLGNTLLANMASSIINYGMKTVSPTFANLPSAAANGMRLFCSDCNLACTAGNSTGQSCVFVNGTWTH